MITLTDPAIVKIKDIVIDAQDDALKLRVFVQGGGCSGMSYGFTLDDDQAEEDFIIPFQDISVLVDATSMQYLQGSTIDYVEDLHGSNFSISNPNAQTTCGCGSSFTPNNM
jgi:iron-sulfur cluster insertion protein